MAKGVKQTIELKNSLEELINTIDKTTKSLKTFANDGVDPLSSSSSKAAKEIQNMDSYMSKLENSTSKTSNSMDKLSSGISAITFRSIISGVKKTWQTFEKFTSKSVDYIEDLNLMKVAFGDTSEEAYDLVRNLSQVTGFDEGTLVRNLGTFRNLTSTLRMTNEQADLLARNLEKMSLDISSLYNTSADRAAYALQGMLTGQPRTIKTLTGANVTQGALQEELAARGIDRKVRSLNAAEKAIVSYLALERQLINSNGDLARTLDQPANMLKIFKEQVSKAARSIGSLLIPVIQSVIPYLTAFLMVLSEVINVFLTFLGVDATSFWNDMEKGAKATATSIGGVGSAAKKAKMGLRGFDRLNVISTPSSSGGSGGGGVGGSLGIDNRLLDQLKEYDLKLDNIKTRATEIRDRIMDWLGFSKIVDEYGNLIGWKYEGIGKTLSNMWESFKKLSFWAKTLVGIGVVAFFSGIISTAKKVITWLGDKTGVTKVVQKLFKATTDLFKNIKNSGLKKGIDDWRKYKTVINENGEVMKVVKTRLDHIRDAAEGAIIMMSGFSLVRDAFKDIANNGLNLFNALEGLTGMIMGIVGAFELLSGVLGILKIELSTGIVGAIAVGVTAIVGFVTWIQNIGDNTDETTKKTQAYREELEKLEDQIANRMVETYAQAGRAEDLKNKLSELVDENGRVRGSHEEVEVILKELNNIMGTNYQLVDDQITLDGKKLKSNKDLADSVQKYIDKLKAQTLIELSQEKIQAIYKRNLELKGDIKKQQDEINASLEEAKKQDGFTYDSWAKNNREQLEKLRKLSNEYATNNKQLEIYAQAGIEAEKGHFDKAQDLMLTTAKNVKVSIKDITNGIIGDTDLIEGEYKELFKALSQLNVNPTGGNTQAFGNMAKKDANAYLNALNTTLSSKKLTAISGGKAISLDTKLTWRANGGFVDAGEMFIAREAGPEMVGKIGGKTAVANNDQIVEAVAQGVASAISGVGNRPVIIQATGDAEGLMKFITFKQQETNMQYGN